MGGAGFLEFLRKVLRHVTDRAARIHPLAPLLVALVFSYVAAELTLWIFRQPLLYFWRFFGWISGHDASRLSSYNTLAHILAFIVAFKVVYEMRPLGGGYD